jgi:hypothetical protein
MATSAVVEGTFARPTPGYSLFDSNAVAIATFFGSPVMGSALMAWNYRRMGETGKAVMSVAIATVVTTLVVVIGWNMNRGGTGVIGLVMLIVMQRTALYLQGPMVNGHVQRGGALRSKWLAFFLGVAFLVLVFGVAFAYVMVTTDHNSVKVGSKDEVIYADGATKEDAQAVGKALKADGFFTDRGVAVIVGKGKDGPMMSFPVDDGVWNQADKVSSFEEVGREMAPLLGGYPIKVRLVDTMRDVKKEVMVGRAAFPGNDDVYYQGGVTQAQAQGVGETLKSADFFEGQGVDVFVAKDGGVTTISFVTNSKAWNDPAMLSDFEKLTRSVAPSLGGLPIRLQLVDNTLVVKKDEVVN